MTIRFSHAATVRITRGLSTIGVVGAALLAMACGQPPAPPTIILGTGGQGASPVGGDGGAGGSEEPVKACEGNLELEAQESPHDFEIVKLIPVDLEALSGCKVIHGNLAIKATNETDLSALSDLQKIEGGLFINRNEQLASLAGLEKLTSVQWIRITDNEALTSVSALSNVSSVNSLTIGGHPLFCDDEAITLAESLGLSNSLQTTSTEEPYEPQTHACIGFCKDNKMCETVLAPPHEATDWGAALQPFCSDGDSRLACFDKVVKAAPDIKLVIPDFAHPAVDEFTSLAPDVRTCLVEEEAKPSVDDKDEPEDAAPWYEIHGNGWDNEACFDIEPEPHNPCDDRSCGDWAQACLASPGGCPIDALQSEPLCNVESHSRAQEVMHCVCFVAECQEECGSMCGMGEPDSATCTACIQDAVIQGACAPALDMCTQDS